MQDISAEEVKRLKKFCGGLDYDEHLLLLTAAMEVNRDLAPDLYYSLVRGVSYESMDRQQYLPIGKSDFYGHQRKTLATFRDSLMLLGRWRSDR